MRKFQYKFLSKELIKESKSKRIVFLNSGIDTKGKWGDAAVFLIEIDGIQTEYSPNSTSITNLGNVWGFESKFWIGKVAEVSV